MAKLMLKNQYGQYLLKVIDEMKEETQISSVIKHCQKEINCYFDF